MKSVIIASTSTIHGSGYLEYLLETLEEHFKAVDEILFIPYARPGGISYDEYTKIVKKVFKKINKTVVGVQEFENAPNAILNAKGIFTGGGNTFVLVNQLYKKYFITKIRSKIHFC